MPVTINKKDFGKVRDNITSEASNSAAKKQNGDELTSRRIEIGTKSKNVIWGSPWEHGKMG